MTSRNFTIKLSTFYFYHTFSKGIGVKRYAKRYRLRYGASKTKITITGSNIDMRYYSEVNPWTLDGERVNVVSDNEHLGLVVSGEREEEKNVDLRIKKGRNSLFGLLGPAFSQKSLISPIVKMHLFSLYTCPITRCGLGSMAIKDPQLKPIDIFQRKCLRSFLSLS